MHIVAVLHIAVVESEVAEQIAFAPAVRLTHCGQRRIHATMVLGNRHLVVVDENDHIAALLGGVVEPLKRNRRAEGAVADHRDHIVRLRRAPRSPYHVTFLRHAACQRDRRAGVPEHEMVVLAFPWVRETGHRAEQLGPAERLGAPREHLVHVALVRHVEHDLVERRFEHDMQCHARLDQTKIGTDMAAVPLAVFDKRLTDLRAQGIELRGIQQLHVGRRQHLRQKVVCHEISDPSLFRRAGVRKNMRAFQHSRRIWSTSCTYYSVRAIRHQSCQIMPQKECSRKPRHTFGVQ